jgi:hypothetical protein
VAAERASELFLTHGLFRRRDDGAVITPSFLQLHHPCDWHYDILFGLEVLAEAGHLRDAGPQSVRAAQPGPGPLHARHVVRAPARSAANRLVGDPAAGTEHVDGLPGRPGLDPKSYEQWANRIEAVLNAQALSAAQVRSALGAGDQVRIPAVLNQMCDEGRLLRDRPVAGWRDARHTYRRFAEALPQLRLDGCDPAEAVALLVERYVARYGPVTLDDVAWWTGLGLGRCRAALDELGDRLAPVTVAGWDGEHLVLRADLDRRVHASRPRVTQLSLLADLDPYTMGFRSRARLLDDARHDFVYDRSGNATSVLLVDGRIAGVWEVLAQRHEARFHPFGVLATAVEERIRAELAAMGAFITGSAVTVLRVDRMTPLTDRSAGWVRKPLHDR